MVNTRKLKAKIVESGYNLGSFANKIGMTRPTLRYKLNNVRCFRTDEIMSFCKLVNIPKSEINSYFFTTDVSKEEH